MPLTQHNGFRSSNTSANYVVCESRLSSIRFIRWLRGGAIDLFLTLVPPAPSAPSSSGTHWLLDHPESLTGWTTLNQLILLRSTTPVSHRHDVLRLFRPDLEKASLDPEWADDRCLLLIANRDHQLLATSRCPFLRFDITEANHAEVRFFTFSILRLSSRCLLRFGKPSIGMAQPLLNQDVSSLPYASKERSQENALDVLSFLIMVCPAISLHFERFDAEIPRRFDSVVEETVSSREGALSYDKVLEFRSKLNKHVSKQSPPSLPEEEEIRKLWP